MVNQDKKNNKQQGVALIMVLGMVAIIAAWASTATYEDMVSIQRVANLQDEMRATMASESAYALIHLYLKQDAQDSQIDSLEEDWAMNLPPFPIDEGMIMGTVIDTNRFYNLNDLVNDAGDIQPAHVEQLKRLFVIANIDPNLVEPLADWLDKNDIPYGTSGAEDSIYGHKNYHVKNARLDSWSELKLILGFEQSILRQLKKITVVRPASANGKTRININTTSIEVLMALFPNLNDVDAEVFLESRPYDNTNSVINQPWAAAGDASRLSVTSDAFMVRTRATFGRANVQEEFLLSRTGQQVKLIWRERLGWQP